MIELIIICVTALIAFFGYLYYQASQSYIEEIEARIPVVDDRDEIISTVLLIKQTYKNGRVKYLSRRIGP